MSRDKVIRYIRDCERRPYGVIVALDREHIGMSLCNKKEKWDKELGLEIAAGRAGLGKKIPLRLYRNDTLRVFDAVQRAMRSLGIEKGNTLEVISIEEGGDSAILQELQDMELVVLEEK